MKHFSAFAAICATVYVLSGFIPPKTSSSFDLPRFGQLPVLDGGRIKPLDTIARTSLLILSGKQTVRFRGRSWSALEWLAELTFRPDEAAGYPVFEIDDPDVLGAIGIEPAGGQRQFAFATLQPKLPEILRLAAEADRVKPEQRSRFQTAILHLFERIDLYHALFTKSWLSRVTPHRSSKLRAEYVFNYFEPFYRCMALYLVAFLLVFISWIVRPQPLQQTAFYLLVLAFIVHTSGLAARMVLQGRPPVTNLYSSAVFVGWAAVLLGIILERLYRKGIGSMVASLIGFTTLIIAHHLMASGDTLEMMRAVLDSNFWLATHVVCITIGYSSTFLSGFLAIIYIVRRLFDKGWNPELAKTLERMVYGIVCFATLFSFVGTVLGGIWADQSWGRFWGWDPKENGALMIVLWNVFILHARWGKYAEGKNLMLLAVVGNIVTALSWFGVNMLGIGLHSYGFMDKAFVWLIVFIVTQIALIAAGFLGRPKSGTVSAS